MTMQDETRVSLIVGRIRQIFPPLPEGISDDTAQFFMEGAIGSATTAARRELVKAKALGRFYGDESLHDVYLATVEELNRISPALTPEDREAFFLGVAKDCEIHAAELRAYMQARADAKA